MSATPTALSPEASALVMQIRDLTARGIPDDDIPYVILTRELLERAWTLQAIARALQCRKARLADLLLVAS